MRRLVFQILSLSNTNSLLADIDIILTENNFPVAAKNYLKYYLKVHIEAVRYMDEGVNYWGKMRELFFNVINQNIEKAWHIQNSMTSVPAKSLRDAYFEIDWSKVLLEQIKSSKDQINGKIWILCTCITFLGDYRFFWNHQMPNK